MTKVKYRSNPVWHETGLLDPHSGRAYCVAESPAELKIRLKGTRTVLTLPWSVAYLRAAYMKTALDNLAAGRKQRKQGVTRGRLS